MSEENKYLSVITNFGCHYECPYCIVRENNLHIPKTTLNGLKNLRNEIRKNQCNWVSVSGGGDPLHHFQEHFNWFLAFIKRIPDDVNTELHTSYLDKPFIAYAMFNRVVYHLRDMNQIPTVRRMVGDQKVRIVFVVTKDFTPQTIDTIVRMVSENENIDELSFRQMVDNHYQATHYCEEYLKAGNKKNWYYIEQDDYNLYYCENVVSTRFEDFKNER